MTPPPTLRSMFARLPEPFTAEPLFDHLPDLVYFIKDPDCRYLVVNRTLVERCGLRDKSQLIGRTAGEVFRAPLGTGFEAQDREVMRTGRPLVGQLELQVYPSRDIGWCLTTKLPLAAADGAVVGLVGVSQDLRATDQSAEGYEHVADAVAYAEAHLADAPVVSRLAEVAGMSPYQLDRRMRGVFGLTTGQWLLRLRLNRAERLLAETAEPIAAVAAAAGYADQSAFTRQFHRATGLTPREYRNARGTT